VAKPSRSALVAIVLIDSASVPDPMPIEISPTFMVTASQHLFRCERDLALPRGAKVALKNPLFQLRNANDRPGRKSTKSAAKTADGAESSDLTFLCARLSSPRVFDV
jgi:hypothetical protein